MKNKEEKASLISAIAKTIFNGHSKILTLSFFVNYQTIN